jgi:pimeloyl-ACP methyl ester carboxylesterase
MERRMSPRGARRDASGQGSQNGERGPSGQNRATGEPDPGNARARLVGLAAAYGDGTLGTPSRFFPAPDQPAVRKTPLGDGPLGTQVVDLSYPSEYEPFLPAARDLHLRATENLTAHARWWTSGRGRPTMVLLHGWGGGNHWVTERTFAVAYWLRHGYDVAAFVLPFHGHRAPGTGAMRSGALFPSPNPLRTNEAFGQAIFDLRALSRFLRSRGASVVGALGMSLGGYTTALWASVAGPDDAAGGGIDFAVAMIPAVSMAKLMWRHGERSPERVQAVKAGITEDLLVDAFAVHTPTTRPARLPRERLFVIAGRGDRITPPEQAEALAAHWGVAVRWFDGGHLAQLGRGEAIRDVRRELGAQGFSGREPRMPRRTERAPRR